MWLTQYRERQGLTLHELGRIIRQAGARHDPPKWVSDTLLERLEGERGFRTVPGLANLIAEVCGATAKQRDRLTLKKYRGQWTPTDRPVNLYRPTPAPASKNAPRETLAIDRVGNIVARFKSTGEAAMRCGIAQTSVCDRCNRRYTVKEFRLTGFTFRYADQWEAMTPEERIADLKGNQPEPAKPEPKVKKPRGGAHYTKAITVITPEGEERHFRSVNDAAAAVGISPGRLSTFLTTGQVPYGSRVKGCRFLYDGKVTESEGLT